MRSFTCVPSTSGYKGLKGMHPLALSATRSPSLRFRLHLHLHLHLHHQPGRSRLQASSSSLRDFPQTYEQVASQASKAAQLALEDGVALQEIEFPPLSLSAVCGDGEGSVEADANLNHTLEVSMLLKKENKNMRIMFPDKDEMDRALDLKAAEYPNEDVNTSFLITPSIFGDIGLDPFKSPIASRITPEEDSLYVIAYPSYNVNEMLAVEELHQEGVEAPIVVINGELDRFRSGYYPSVFYPKIAKMSSSFIPEFEAVYYIHNFKGRNPGVLFRKYPEDWKVYRRGRDNKVLECIHSQPTRPTLKEIALEYFC